MFGYVKKSKVLKIIDNSINQLKNQEIDVVLNIETSETEKERLDLFESISKLKGGMNSLEGLKKHFK